MYNKIIGFTISSKSIDHGDIDVFNVGLNIIQFDFNQWHVYLWGIGDLEQCIVSEKYSLSFPLTESLKERNILIGFSQEHIIVENDWLGAIPVFINQQEKIASTLINIVVSKLDLDTEGLIKYLYYGYSVLGKTPLKYVSFLRYYSRLRFTKTSVQIEKKDDFVINDFLKMNQKTHSHLVLNKIHKKINKLEDCNPDIFLIPTSGGYDSRLLNSMVDNKEKVRAFSFGLSSAQSDSFEVKIAREVTKKIGVEWEQIYLNDYFKLINQWHKLYGVSVHSHGMYQVEFYQKIKNKFCLDDDIILLSGIVGDVWSGKVSIPEVRQDKDFEDLAFTHSAKFQKKSILFSNDFLLENKFIEENGTLLNSFQGRLVTAVRLKIILLSYLMNVPEYFGLPSYSPFLDYDIVKDILFLSPKDRKNRQWQVDYFKDKEILFDALKSKSSKRNLINYHVRCKTNFEPITTDVLNKFVKPLHIQEINKCLNKNNGFTDLEMWLFTTPILKEVIKKIGFRNNNAKLFTDYLMLKPIDLTFKENG